MGNKVDNTKLSNQAMEWVNKNLTKTTSELLAEKISNCIYSVLSAPYEIAMGLIVLLNKKNYGKYLLVFWSVLSIIVYIACFIIYFNDNTFPLSTWSLGIGIGTVVVLFLCKHKINIKVNSDFAKEIEEEIKRLSVLNQGEITEDLDNLYSGSEAESNKSKEDDDELLDDSDDELLDDSDDLFDSIYDDNTDTIKDNDSSIDTDNLDLDSINEMWSKFSHGNINNNNMNDIL